jgi:hypothetical protein
MRLTSPTGNALAQTPATTIRQGSEWNGGRANYSQAKLLEGSSKC